MDMDPEMLAEMMHLELDEDGDGTCLCSPRRSRSKRAAPHGPIYMGRSTGVRSTGRGRGSFLY